MTRTVAVFENSAILRSVSELLEKSGIAVRYKCKSFENAVRAINEMGGGVVICGYKCGEITAEQVYEQIGDKASVLLLAKQMQLDMCSDGIIKIALPVRPYELVAQVEELLKEDNQRGREKSESDCEIITEAKEIIMNRFKMTEAEAHRFIQRKSMQERIKMTETARRIINGNDNTEIKNVR